MTGSDYCTDPGLCARLTRYAAHITNRETREDALQEAFCDILALSHVSIDEAYDTGKAAIERVKKSDNRYLSRCASDDGLDSAPCNPRYSPEHYTA